MLSSRVALAAASHDERQRAVTWGGAAERDVVWRGPRAGARHAGALDGGLQPGHHGAPARGVPPGAGPAGARSMITRFSEVPAAWPLWRTCARSPNWSRTCGRAGGLSQGSEVQKNLATVVYLRGGVPPGAGPAGARSAMSQGSGLYKPGRGHCKALSCLVSHEALGLYGCQRPGAASVASIQGSEHGKWHRTHDK